jgi:NADH:ubiquinone oxidoreductase subunit 6 (subunit J)
MLKRHTLPIFVSLAVAAVLLAAEPAGAQQAAPGDVAQAGGSLHDVLFYVFGGITMISALGVVFSTNIVRTATWLFGALGAVAVLFFLLLANLLGAIQLIVYAGGILVLIVFGIMLTSKSPWMRYDPKPVEVIVGCAVCLVLLIGLTTVLTQADWAAGAKPADGVFPVAELGQALLTDYLLPFEVASVLLLAVMVGAAYLARPERKTG